MLYIFNCRHYLTGMHTDAKPIHMYGIPAYIHTENAYVYNHVCNRPIYEIDFGCTRATIRDMPVKTGLYIR